MTEGLSHISSEAGYLFRTQEGPLERELLQVCWVWAAGCGHASSVRPPFPPSLSSFCLTVTLRIRSWWETIHMVESSYVSFSPPRRFSAWSGLMWREKRSLTEARNFASATGLDIFFAEMSILVTWCDQRTFHYLRMTRKRKGPVLILSSGGQRTSPPEQMRTSSRVKNRAKLQPSESCLLNVIACWIRSYKIYLEKYGLQFSSVQSLSHVWLFATSWTAAHQSSLSITNSWSLLKLMSIELMVQSTHLLLCQPLLFLPSIISQHHDLFQWVSSSHQVAKVLEFQLQHQSFQWTPRTDLL